MNTTKTAPDLREASHSYAYIVHRQGLCRVIRCRDDMQWIVQVASASRPDVWRSESYPTARNALIREWTKRVPGTLPDALSEQPEHYRSKAQPTA